MSCGSENTLTGVGGVIYVAVPETGTGVLVQRITTWSVNPTLATSTEWGDSNTEGYSAFQPGRKTATFTAEGKYDSGTEVWDQFFIGSRAAVWLYIQTALFWAFPCAVCNDFSLEVDVDGQTVVGWTSAWNADGKFYFPGQSGTPLADISV